MTHEHLDLPNIAFIGKAGAGKTTAAQFLVDNFGYTRLSFATPLREVAVKLWGERARNDRHLLQSLGVAVREIEADTWVNLAVDAMHEPETARWVVDDCRFENEVWRLAEAGFVFARVTASRNARIARLQASGKLTDEAQLDHPSETQLDSLKTSYLLGNDSGVMPLSTQIIEMLDRERS